MAGRRGNGGPDWGNIDWSNFDLRQLGGQRTPRTPRPPRRRTFVISAIVLALFLLPILFAPLIGFLTSGDRGLLMGLAVGGLAGFWIWWEGEPVRNEPEEQKSAK